MGREKTGFPDGHELPLGKAPALPGDCAPGSRRDQRGESPLPGDARSRVANGNCAAVRRGGEQPEANMQSVG